MLGAKSYKSDDKAKQTPQRLEQRRKLVGSLELGNTRLRLRLELDHLQAEMLCRDASGDTLDSVLCLVQAAWGARHGWPRFGLPLRFDALEGWIVSA